MKLPQSIKTFLSSLPIREMRGSDKVVAVTFFLAKGSKEPVRIQEIKKEWSKTVFGITFNDSYVNGALGRIHRSSRGMVALTDEGISYIERQVGLVPSQETALIVFKKRSGHTFDKFIRNTFKESSKSVDIADTYVSGQLFDRLLDEIPTTTPIRFLYGHDKGGFVARSGRFQDEYNLKVKNSQDFHDRFLIVDGKGYIIGPSLKDAADKKPATVVSLDKEDSQKLKTLFEDLWSS